MDAAFAFIFLARATPPSLLPAASRRHVSSRLRLRSSRRLRHPRREIFFLWQAGELKPHGTVQKPRRFQRMRDDTPATEEGQKG